MLQLTLLKSNQFLDKVIFVIFVCKIIIFLLTLLEQVIKLQYYPA